MCWIFDGLVDVESGASELTRFLIPPTGCTWAYHECISPDHSPEAAPAHHQMPLELQWKIASWAAKIIQRFDAETSAKFYRIAEQKLSLGCDQSIFDKYLLRVRQFSRKQDPKIPKETNSFAAGLASRSTPVQQSSSDNLLHTFRRGRPTEIEKVKEEDKVNLPTIRTVTKSLNIIDLDGRTQRCIKCGEIRQDEYDERRDSGMFDGAI